MKITNDRIILDSDPRIRSKSEPVTLPLSKEDEELLRAMITYVRDSQDDEIAEREGLRPAVGIAAIQLGIPKQLIAVSVPTEDGSDEFALANPKIVSESRTPISHRARAACPSWRNTKASSTVMRASR